MKTTNIKILALTVLITAFGCQSQNKPQQEQEVNPYLGEWTSVEPEDLGNGTFGSRYFNITSEGWEVKFTLFLDSAQKMPVFEFRGKGTYEIQQPSASIPGAENAIFRFDQKFLTLLNDDEQVMTNFGLSACGLVKSTEKEITENGCSFLVSKSACAQEFDLLKLVEDNLYFGRRPADGNMCTEEKRPTELSYPLKRK